jgi:hypothetical protein
MTERSPRSEVGILPEHEVVGEGPLYELMRSEARGLIPLFAPGGITNCDSYWGAGFCGITHQDDGEKVSVTTYDWERRALSHHRTFSIRELRAAAVSLLVYCEAHDAKS